MLRVPSICPFVHPSRASKLSLDPAAVSRMILQRQPIHDARMRSTQPMPSPRRRSSSDHDRRAGQTDEAQGEAGLSKKQRCHRRICCWVCTAQYYACLALPAPCPPSVCNPRPRITVARIRSSILHCPWRARDRRAEAHRRPRRSPRLMAPSRAYNLVPQPPSQRSPALRERARPLMRRCASGAHASRRGAGRLPCEILGQARGEFRWWLWAGP